MHIPQLQLIPLRAAIPSGCPTLLDVLVKVIPPHIPTDTRRPCLNLSLVIDRSSSMAMKRRLVFAKAAARHIVQSLAPGDRVSIVTFDRRPKILVPSTVVSDRSVIMDAIHSIQVGKWTNLHGGWVEGGEQVHQHIYPDTVNRIILLTDGWASAGVLNRSTITAHVQELAQAGISTTTVGVGNDYNEDLLEAMATEGDGNYYYISAPEHLPKAFEREMQALIATVGQQVTLGIQPQDDVEINDVLNDLPLTRQGRFKLPNLVAGYSFGMILRLDIPATPLQLNGSQRYPKSAIADSLDLLQVNAPARNLCTFRLAWKTHSDSPESPLRCTLQLPVVPPNQLNHYPCNVEVQRQVAIMLAARLKRSAVTKADRKDYDEAQACLHQAKSIVLAAPQSQWLELEAIALEALESDLRSRQIDQFRKRGHSEAYQTSNSYDQASGIFDYGDR